MTRAFLEPLVLTPKSEDFIKLAFSQESKEKLQKFEKVARKSFRRTAKNKLSIKDLF